MPIAVFTKILAFLMCLTQSSAIEPSWTDDKQVNKGHASTEVFCDVGWIGPGQTFNIVVLLTPDKVWHVYWKNPGISGTPTEFEINAPDGFIIGEPMFPRPAVFHNDEGPTYGYHQPVAIFIPVTAPHTLDDGTVTFQVTTSWLSCRKICVMGEQTKEVSCSIHVSDHGPLHRDLRLSRWRDKLPPPLSALKEGKTYHSGNTLHISGTSDLRPIQFLGVERVGVRFDHPEPLVSQGTSFRLPVPLILDFGAVDGEPLVIEGLLTFGRNQDDPAYVVHIIVTPEDDFR